MFLHLLCDFSSIFRAFSCAIFFLNLSFEKECLEFEHSGVNVKKSKALEERMDVTKPRLDEKDILEDHKLDVKSKSVLEEKPYLKMSLADNIFEYSKEHKCSKLGWILLCWTIMETPSHLIKVYLVVMRQNSAFRKD